MGAKRVAGAGPDGCAPFVSPSFGGLTDTSSGISGCDAAASRQAGTAVDRAAGVSIGKSTVFFFFPRKGATNLAGRDRFFCLALILSSWDMASGGGAAAVAAVAAVAAEEAAVVDMNGARGASSMADVEAALLPLLELLSVFTLPPRDRGSAPRDGMNPGICGMS